MNDYSTLHNRFYDKQCGLRKKHSTELDALNAVDTVINQSSTIN